MAFPPSAEVLIFGGTGSYPRREKAEQKARERADPVPVLDCQSCGACRRHSSQSTGVSGSLPAMLNHNREHEIILNFGPDTRRDGGMKVHALHPDCKTVLSHWQAVESLETLRKMMRYLGATDEQMASFKDDLRRWGQGSVHIRLLPNRRNLLHIDYSRL